MAPASPSVLVGVGGGRQKPEETGSRHPCWRGSGTGQLMPGEGSGRKAVGRRAAGGLGGQTLNLSIPAAPFSFRGLRPRVGMRPGLVETELSLAGLTALAQGGM